MQLSINTQGQQITLSTPLASISFEATDQLQTQWQGICMAYNELSDSLQSILVPDMNEMEQQKHWIALLQTKITFVV